MKRLVCISGFIFFFLSSQLNAQVFGGNSSKTKWKQINADSFKIIFPNEVQSSAIRIANVISELQKGEVESKYKKISIVLQNQTTFSNAYVGLAPWRSEFYLTSPQNTFELGSLQWLDNLAIHEYKHVQQYNQFNKGLSNIMGAILGQEGRAVANAASIPDWFFEGDAVYNETFLSKQGRGRLPGFFNGYKSLLNSNNRNAFSFSKLRNGSLKNYVPNHYELGYLLVAYGREKYGNNIWQKITEDAASFKPLFYPFQGALKRHTGISYTKFVEDAFSFYKNQWNETKQEPFKWLTIGNDKFRSDYLYPYLINNQEVIVLKKSFREIPTFYKVDLNGKQEKISVREIAYDNYFSTNGKQIVYTSLRTDSRWGNEEFTDINILDITTKEKKRIKSNLKLFSPDISNDAETIVAVELNSNQNSSLILLNKEGKEIKRMNGKNNEVFSYPKFIKLSTNEIIVLSRKLNGEMALLKVNFTSNHIDTLIPYANRIMGFPTVQNNIILLTVTHQQNDEIWKFDLSINQLLQVANYNTGLYQAAFNTTTNQLITSAFTNLGQQLAVFNSNQLINELVDFKEKGLTDLYVPSTLKSNQFFSLENLPARNFEIKEYSKSHKLLNIHSWRPYYNDPDFSFTLYGQNVLNTFQSEIAYTYNRNEGNHKVGFTGVYGGWFLQPTLGINKTWDRNIRLNNDTTIFWNEWNRSVGVRLPLNFTSGKHFQFLNISTHFYNEQVKWTGLAKQLLKDANFNYLEIKLQFTSQSQKAVQHIYPRWAQSLLIQNRFIVDNYSAHQLLVSGSFYFPGILKTHNLILSASFQNRDTLNQYYFTNHFSFSRGYKAVNFPKMVKVSANYHLPLVYPDWGFGNIVYFLRIRANIFYDATQTKSLRTGNKFFFNTAGAEIFIDSKWWNQQEISFGVRYSRLLDKELSGTTKPNQWEFIVPINLFNN